MGVEIREITKEDKDAFLSLSLGLTKLNKRQHDKFFTDFEKIIEVRKQRVEKRFEKLKESTNLTVFLALVDNKPVGYIRIFVYDEKLRYGCLDELYITQQARGQGIGKKLVDAAMGWMKEEKVVRIITSVYSWNESARNFYEQEGFCEYAVSYERSLSSES